MGKFFAIMFGLLVLSMLIAFSWEHVPAIKENVHKFLDPSLGALLTWNLTWGMTIIIFLIALITTLLQKYFTDQKAIKELKDEQKELQKEVRELKHDPQKALEINQKNMQRSMEITGKIMQLTMKTTIFTIIPFILLFRWFMDFFVLVGNPKFFGFMSWFWFYLIFVMVFSSIFRKLMNVH